MKKLAVFILVLLSFSAFSQNRDFDPHSASSYCFDFMVGRRAHCVTFDVNDSSIVAQNYIQKGRRWKYDGSQINHPVVQSGDMSFPDSVYVLLLPNEKSYIKYSFLHTSKKEMVYTSGLFDYNNGSFYELSFSGNALKADKGSAFKIEGLSSYALAQESMEVNYLDSLFKADSRLITISQADMRSDAYISWWLESNPNSMTNARMVEFGSISEDSSIYTAFSKAKKSEKGRLRAAVVNVRGYSCVVVKNTKSKSDLLVWAEPECKNRKTDRYLSHVYFQDENTLVLFYYKGKSVFKYRINLATHSLRRS